VCECVCEGGGMGTARLMQDDGRGARFVCVVCGMWDVVCGMWHVVCGVWCVIRGVRCWCSCMRRSSVLGSCMLVSCMLGSCALSAIGSGLAVVGSADVAGRARHGNGISDRPARGHCRDQDKMCAYACHVSP
jgi:hypothetical protein